MNTIRAILKNKISHEATQAITNGLYYHTFKKKIKTYHRHHTHRCTHTHTNVRQGQRPRTFSRQVIHYSARFVHASISWERTGYLESHGHGTLIKGSFCWLCGGCVLWRIGFSHECLHSQTGHPVPRRHWDSIRMADLNFWLLSDYLFTSSYIDRAHWFEKCIRMKMGRIYIC